jgi:histidine ammonia-lyase
MSIGESAMTTQFVLDGQPLALDAVVEIARGSVPVVLGPLPRERIAQGRRVVDAVLASGRTVYGINTGFGELASVRIPPDKLRELQVNLLRSHAIGSGEPLPADVVRAMLLLRAHSLAAGYSGVRVELVEALLACLNAGLVPVVPPRGSLGASGDLIPLAHLALVLIGEGEATVNGRRLGGSDALAACHLAPIELAEKEGLALINGTQQMCAMGALLVADAEMLLDSADTAAAMSVEALKGSHAPFDEAIHALRPHPGQVQAAAHMRALLGESEIQRSHADCDRVQDPYSLRCVPQVHGASRDVIAFLRTVIEREIAAVTDNPLCFPESGRVLSGGNFHGQILALALDSAALAIAEIASISERRIYRLLDPRGSGLPAFLAADPGLDSGLMLAQYLAAALVAENRVLCHPASTDSIPTSAGMEDHVSMGATAALKARRVYENTLRVVAIEFLCAAQGLSHHAPLRSTAGVECARAVVREESAPLTRDRSLAADVERLAARVQSGALRGV